MHGLSFQCKPKGLVQKLSLWWYDWILRKHQNEKLIEKEYKIYLYIESYSCLLQTASYNDIDHN